jgi:hypothetical protein
MAVKHEFEYRMTEEVVRWRFEIAMRESKDWWIAFTNPTAGPWKRLSGRDDEENEGEVYRFPRDEDRPDVVAVNDSRKLLLIIEAKDAFERLLSPDQIAKSCDVVLGLTKALSALGDNPYWKQRSSYTVIAGFLWGREARQASADAPRLFALYGRGLPKTRLVAFEVAQQSDGGLVIREVDADAEPKSALRILG